MKRLLLSIFLFSCTASALAEVVTLHNGDKYELSKELGSGSYGTVYSAIALKDGSTVAIKLFDSRTDYDRESQARLRQVRRSEGGEFILKILGSGVVRSADFIADDFHPVGAIVMEPVAGTLFQVSHFFQIGEPSGERSNITRPSAGRKSVRVGKLAYQLLQLWCSLSSNQLIHGDIKPENIGYVGDNFDLRLLDLGSIIQGPLNNSHNHRVFATEGFDAPEVKKYWNNNLPEGEVLSSYADLYSLSRTLTSLLCDGCDAVGLERAILDWYDRLKPRSTRDAAIGNFLFALDIVKAGNPQNPAVRYELLREGPIGKFLKFRRSASSGATEHYAFQRPSVRRSLTEIQDYYQSVLPERIGQIRQKFAFKFPGQTKPKAEVKPAESPAEEAAPIPRKPSSAKVASPPEPDVQLPREPVGKKSSKREPEPEPTPQPVPVPKSGREMDAKPQPVPVSKSGHEMDAKPKPVPVSKSGRESDAQPKPVPVLERGPVEAAEAPAPQRTHWFRSLINRCLSFFRNLGRR